MKALIEPIKTHRDARGCLFEPLADVELTAQRNVHVVITQPDEVRGNHCHAARPRSPAWSDRAWCA